MSKHQVSVDEYGAVRIYSRFGDERYRSSLLTWYDEKKHIIRRYENEVV